MQVRLVTMNLLPLLLASSIMLLIIVPLPTQANVLGSRFSAENRQKLQEAANQATEKPAPTRILKTKRLRAVRVSPLVAAAESGVTTEEPSITTSDQQSEGDPNVNQSVKKIRERLLLAREKFNKAAEKSAGQQRQALIDAGRAIDLSKINAVDPEAGASQQEDQEKELVEEKNADNETKQEETPSKVPLVLEEIIPVTFRPSRPIPEIARPPQQAPERPPPVVSRPPLQPEPVDAQAPVVPLPENEFFGQNFPAFRDPLAREPIQHIPINKQIHKLNSDGSYTYGYESMDGFKLETRLPNGDVIGKYGYYDSNGKLNVVEYGADTRLGFVPKGDGIQAPPTLFKASNESGSQPLFELDFNSEELASNRPRPAAVNPPTPPPFIAFPVQQPPPAAIQSSSPFGFQPAPGFAPPGFQQGTFLPPRPLSLPPQQQFQPQNPGIIFQQQPPNNFQQQPPSNFQQRPPFGQPEQNPSGRPPAQEPPAQVQQNEPTPPPRGFERQPQRPQEAIQQPQSPQGDRFFNPVNLGPGFFQRPAFTFNPEFSGFSPQQTQFGFQSPQTFNPTLQQPQQFEAQRPQRFEPPAQQQPQFSAQPIQFGQSPQQQIPFGFAPQQQTQFPQFQQFQPQPVPSRFFRSNDEFPGFEEPRSFSRQQQQQPRPLVSQRQRFFK